MIVKYQIWITIYWQYRQLSLHPRLYGNVGMFGSQVASHDHCLLYSASLIKTNKQTTVKDVIAFYLQTLHIWKNFCKFEKDSERSLTFLPPIFISVQFPVGKWESLLATFNCLLFFLQLANKFGKHDLFQGSHGIVFTHGVTLERLDGTQACLWSKVKFCTRPEGWCSWVAKKGLGAKKVSFDTLPRPCIGRSVKVSLHTCIPLMLQWK